ncbi:MAG TPA: extracellular solute-binding protein [Limnochordia bacterium]|nr:extracellular solute-binding protein [Limnochordia bacterium]
MALADEPTIQYWAWWTVSQEDLQKAEKAIGAKIDYRQLNWGDVESKLLTAVIAGSGPDVIYVDPSWFDAFASKGVLTDLNPYLKTDNDSLWKDIFPSGMELWQSDGKQWAVPNNVAPTLFWYNGTLMDDLGLARPDDSFDWNTWLADSRKAARDKDGDGRLDTEGFMPWWWEIGDLIRSNGGTLFTDGKLSINSQATRDALTFFKQVREFNLIEDWEQLPKYPQHPDAAWWDGAVLFAPGGDWIGPSVQKDGKWTFDIQVAPAPKSPIGQRSALLRGNGLAITSSSKHKDLAYKLIKYFLSDDVQKQTAQNGQLPGRISIAHQYYLTGGVKYPYDRNTIIQSLAYQQGPDKNVDWSETYGVWNSPIKAEADKFLRGQESMDAMMTNMAKLVNAILDKQ